MNKFMYYISPKFLSINKMHLITSGDENSLDPDQLGSCLIWICSEEEKKSRLIMKAVTFITCIPDFKKLRNASHIYACTQPIPKIYGYCRNVRLWHFRWPKCPWPNCPSRNILGQNVRGRNVPAPTHQFKHVFKRVLNMCLFETVLLSTHNIRFG